MAWNHKCCLLTLDNIGVSFLGQITFRAYSTFTPSFSTPKLMFRMFTSASAFYAQSLRSQEAIVVGGYGYLATLEAWEGSNRPRNILCLARYRAPCERQRVRRVDERASKTENGFASSSLGPSLSRKSKPRPAVLYCGHNVGMEGRALCPNACSLGRLVQPQRQLLGITRRASERAKSGDGDGAERDVSLGSRGATLRH